MWCFNFCTQSAFNTQYLSTKMKLLVSYIKINIFLNILNLHISLSYKYSLLGSHNKLWLPVVASRYPLKEWVKGIRRQEWLVTSAAHHQPSNHLDGDINFWTGIFYGILK